MLDIYVKQYEAGLTIKQIAEQNNVSYETVRKEIKGKVQFRKKYITDLTEEQKQDIINKYNNDVTLDSLSKEYKISTPTLSRLLKANNITVRCSARKYDLIRATPINLIQKQFIVGHLLGDGCIYKDGPNGIYKLSVSQKKQHEQYFHWKVAMLDPFINTYRENVDKRGNSVMLQTTTICHPGLNQFADMFYTKDRIKVVPKNLDMYFTPLTLAVWIMDDGSLNMGVNMRIATMSFSYEDHVLLQNYLKSVFDIRCKIMGFKYKNKEYHQLTLNKENTQKLSDIIRPHVVDCMKYKIMPESSTTTC
jgi:predicted DNA-binding protein YlxM (UPF0122 family)